MFHVSMLLKYVSDYSYVLSLNLVELDPNLYFENEPIAILDMQVRKHRTMKIASVKVQWKHHSVSEVTLETKSDMCIRYPQLFRASGIFF